MKTGRSMTAPFGIPAESTSLANRRPPPPGLRWTSLPTGPGRLLIGTNLIVGEIALCL